MDGEELYYISHSKEKINVGSLLKTGMGYQYVLKNNAYVMFYDAIDMDSQIVIRYLNNGYYEKISEYDTLPSGPVGIMIADYDSKEIRVACANDTLATEKEATINASKEYNDSELNILNKQ